MDDDMRSKLMRIRGVQEALANLIVGSGLTMERLSKAEFIALAFSFGVDDEMAERIRFAAVKFSIAAGQGLPMNEALDKLRNSRIVISSLVDVGLLTEEAESVVLFEGNWWELAIENPARLNDVLGISPSDCVRVIALARLFTVYNGDGRDLREYLANVEAR